jgi:Tol biopolymer transport system component
VRRTLVFLSAVLAAASFLVAILNARKVMAGFEQPVAEGLPRHAAAGAGSGRIVFVIGGNIYIMNDDGSGVMQLTNTGNNSTPNLSPDGMKVAFTSFRDDPKGEIYVMNADGSGVTRLTTNPGSAAFNFNNGFDSSPSFSPDGQRIAFMSSRNFNEDIHVMNADGTGVTRLTTNSGIDDFDPTWSPDGTRIAFVREVSVGVNEIYIMNANGTGQTGLTNDGVTALNPEFSPDGMKIAFDSTRDGGQADREVYVMDADGTDITRLTVSDNGGPLERISRQPSFSPDGTSIAFAGTRGNPVVAGIFRMSSSGGTVTHLGTLGEQPDWGNAPNTPNTPAGNNITVQSAAGEASVTFTQVTSAGTTTFTPINPPSSGGSPPPGYTILGSGPAFGITTTAAYTPPVTVCFSVSSVNDAATFERVRILHGENGALVDRTLVAPDALAPDFAMRRVCARVNSLSPFVAALAPASSPGACSVSGVVTYGTSPTGQSAKFVPGAVLTAVGSVTTKAMTNGSGEYTVSGLGTGPYTVTPSKTGDVNGISALDAARVAQHAAGLITLNSNQIVAGDATNNGTLSALDAARIAQYAAGISNPGIAGQWKFVPPSRPYQSVVGSVTGENYEAILVGDVTGNWTAPTAAPRSLGDEAARSGSFAAEPVAAPSELMVPADSRLTKAVPGHFAVNGSAAAVPGGKLTIPVSVGDTAGRGVLAYEFTVEFDPDVLRPAAFDTSATLSAGWTVAINAIEPGVLRVAAFSTAELAGEGTLLNLRFDVLDSRTGGRVGLKWSEFVFNEGSVPVIISGALDSADLSVAIRAAPQFVRCPFPPIGLAPAFMQRNVQTGAFWNPEASGS